MDYLEKQLLVRLFSTCKIGEELAELLCKTE